MLHCHTIRLWQWSISLKPVSRRDSEYRAADNIAEINLRGKLALYEKVFAAYGYAYKVDVNGERRFAQRVEQRIVPLHDKTCTEA